MKTEKGLHDDIPWASWLPEIMYSMNTEKHSITKELPYRIVFGRGPPNQTNPLSEQQIVDERDLDGTEQITRPPIPAPWKPVPSP